MHDFLITLNNSLPVFLTIGVVLFLRARGILKKAHAESISPLLFKVVLPLFAFQVTYKMSLAFSDVSVLVFVLLATLLQLPLLIFLNKFFALKRATLGAVLLLSLGFAVGPVAYPFVQLNFEPAVFAKLVSIDIMLFITIMVLGPIIGSMYDHNKQLNYKKIGISLLTDPVLVAVLCGATLNITNFELPASIQNSVAFVATPFTFLVTVLVGLTLDKPDADKLKVLSWITLARFAFGVGVSLLVVMLFKPPRELALAVPLTIVMAFSSFPLVYSERYNLDTELVAQASLFSRIAILPLYPILITVLKMALK